MTQQAQRILVIETSGRAGSTALGTEAGVAAAARLPEKMRHAGELLPTVADLLQAQGWSPDSLTDVWVSIGPGSFTGLRIAVTVARTLAWSAAARLVAVPTVDGLALNALAADPLPAHVAVVLDAKRGQVYAAAFEVHGGECRKIVDAHLADPLAFLRGCPHPVAVLGEGVPYHRPAIEAAGARILPEDLWWPRAEHVFQVGQALAREGRYTPSGDLMPLYIRRPEAEEKWEKLHGSG